ncbi:hypothetical protein FRB95_013501 [Tulasnella sp. JGI-2019a]|nr:hypothetical protein FRB95_013501 [Tulasnella sp. JGI-2019a]
MQFEDNDPRANRPITRNYTKTQADPADYIREVRNWCYTFADTHGQTMTNESEVNGVWNSILARHYYPYPEYLICPEHWTKDRKGRVDMVITRINDRKVMLAYEGKKEGQSEAQAVRQMTGYIQSLVKPGDNRIFGMIAVGSVVAFMAADVDDVRYLKASASGTTGEVHDNTKRVWMDAQTQSHEIHVVLEYIKAKCRR